MVIWPAVPGGDIGTSLRYMSLEVIGAWVLVHVGLKAIPKIGRAGGKLLVPLGAAAAVAIGAGVKGAVDTVKGRSIRNEAQKRFGDAIAECEATRVDTERAAREYGEFQIGVHKETVGQFADWLERNEYLVKRLNFKKVDWPLSPTLARLGDLPPLVRLVHMAGRHPRPVRPIPR